MTKDLSPLPDNVEFIPAAKRDYLSLDRSVRIAVVKAMSKVATNPRPANEGGYGKPLGSRNGSDLHGLLKIKLKRFGIRIVYKYVVNNDGVRVIVIGARDDGAVYRLAVSRLSAMGNG